MGTRLNLCRTMCSTLRTGPCFMVTSIFFFIGWLMWLLVFFLYANRELQVVNYNPGLCYIFNKQIEWSMCNTSLCARPAFFLNLQTPYVNITTVAYNSVTGSYSTNIPSVYSYLNRYGLYWWFRCYYNPHDPSVVVFYHNLPVGPIVAAVLLGIWPCIATLVLFAILLSYCFYDRYDECRCSCSCPRRTSYRSMDESYSTPRASLISSTVPAPSTTAPTAYGARESYPQGASYTPASGYAAAPGYATAPSCGNASVNGLDAPPGYEYVMTHPNEVKPL
eukprot:Amastigsp_a677354_52.p1 type:complete len:278 gc:universal Amastigsp_a677354_52:843-10(-)